ncbi:hypothetical protein H8356DRAFT_970094 [Neocallimastix lanati (nom. inval.)]|uniref:Uncharacterized protein n=1 Tax=Neocallimastix californiae TaxID=1754190 RepID=A0A1Y2FRG3_9FUNG|nr:hypothetical protein H8356DRAFT_970094 [Neocallimastix sp. JGI-2020a]ORY85786.1 hypothetical protein LY90DRAFT_156811 [Neocallimastix californiae]|eukprot:ORY85786.1 hypothetical protein LY90DRAFT_156811 [Neocallimastix californiae]
MSEKEEKKNTSVKEEEEKIVKKSLTFKDIKAYYLDNYDSENTIKILSIVVGFELLVMAYQNLVVPNRRLLLIPYVLAISSIGLFYYGILKHKLSFMKQFRFVFIIFYIYYILSMMLAILSVIAVLIVIYFGSNPPPKEKTPSLMTFITGTFPLYGLFQFFLYVSIFFFSNFL